MRPTLENRDKFIELAEFHLGCAQHHKGLASEIEAMIDGSPDNLRELVIDDARHHVRETERHFKRAKEMRDLASQLTDRLIDLELAKPASEASN